MKAFGRVWNRLQALRHRGLGSIHDTMRPKPALGSAGSPGVFAGRLSSTQRASSASIWSSGSVLDDQPISWAPSAWTMRSRRCASHTGVRARSAGPPRHSHSRSGLGRRRLWRKGDSCIMLSIFAASSRCGGARSLAFPAIATGVYGFPPVEAASIAISTLS